MMPGQDYHVTIDSIRDLKLCCALSAAVGNYRVANERGACFQCGNVLIGKLADFPVWGPVEPDPNKPRRLAKDIGIVAALYALPEWTDLRVERDLGGRGLDHGVWKEYRNQLVVMERPLDWIERATLSIVAPRDVHGVKFLVGRLAPDYRDGRVPTDPELVAATAA